mgnify:CR=1 FL=1
MPAFVKVSMQRAYSFSTGNADGVLLAEEAVAVLPAQLIHDLYSATTEADLDQLMELIDIVKTHDPGLGQSLYNLAQNFDYRSLLELLHTGGND